MNRFLRILLRVNPRAHVTARTLIATAILHLCSALPAGAVVLSDDNSLIQIDPATQAGMSKWDMQNLHELQQQWFWFALGNGAPASIDAISAPVVLASAPNHASISYALPGSFTLSVDYTLHGGTNVPIGPGYDYGIARSELIQNVTISNSSSAVLPFHLYQYAHFTLWGQFGYQNAEVDGFTGHYFEALHSASPWDYVDASVIGDAFPNYAEAGLYPSTLMRLNSGNPVTLGAYIQFPPTVGPGDVTWALQWDLNLVPGASITVGTDEYLQNLRNIPEPTPFALLALGLLGRFILRIRR